MAQISFSDAFLTSFFRISSGPGLRVQTNFDFILAIKDDCPSTNELEELLRIIEHESKISLLLGEYLFEKSGRKKSICSGSNYRLGRCGKEDIMGEMISARCSECGYESGTLMLGGGMMAVWSVSNSVACVCHDCKSIVCATVYMKPEDIEKEIEQILENRECRWSFLTEDHEQAVKEIKKALKKSRKQQAEGIKCPKCKSVKVEVIDRRKDVKCPKCGKGIMLFEHVGCCD